MKFAFAFPWRQLPWWLGLAVLIIGAVVLLLLRLERRRKIRLDRFVDSGLAPRLLAGFDARVRRPLFWFVVLGAIALAFTFAQPHWGQAWLEVAKQSRDVVVCLDTSESMRAVNPLPNRMERAKQKIAALLGLAPGERFGLVVFSGAAELQCPLTVDHGYFLSVLNAIDTDTISAEGTNIAAALQKAADVFKAEAEKTGDYSRDARAILLISDGEAVSGDALAAAEEASKYARIYVIGVGDPNGAMVTLPDWMGQYVKGEDQKHLSKLDEDTLRKLAIDGGGGYHRSTPNNKDIEEIYGEIARDRGRLAESDVRLRLVNRYQWPLAAAIAFFAAEGLWLALLPWVRGRRFRKGGTDRA